MRYAEAEMESGNQYYLFRYSLAEIHAVRGHTNEALDWLERATETGWVELNITLKDPLLTPLHDEPRFKAIVSAMRERRARLQKQASPAQI